MTFACGGTFVVVAETFAVRAEGKVLYIADCFRAVVVAVWWRSVGTIAAVGHSHHSQEHLVSYCETFDVLPEY